MTICLICNKDHSKKNDGPLTACELGEYLRRGNKVNRGGKSYYAFGSGRRFQFNE